MPRDTFFGLNYIDPRALIAADLDPNTSAPADGRTIQAPLSAGAINGHCFKMLVTLLDGTSVSVSLWVKVAARGVTRWVELTPAPLAVAADAAILIENLPPSSEMFLQVTAAAGAPTLLGAAFLM